MPEPTDPRRQQAGAQRELLIAVIVVLLVVGGGLIALIYGGGAGLLGLPCLIAGVVIILVLWLVLRVFERLGGD